MDAASAEDLFRPFAKVSVKKLFGGLGIYCEGLIFACVIRSEVFLRTDPTSEPAFEAAGSQKWNYVHEKSKAKVAMPYWRLPEIAFDDEAELVRFSRMAFEAATRAKLAKPRAKRSETTAKSPRTQGTRVAAKRAAGKATIPGAVAVKPARR